MSCSSAAPWPAIASVPGPHVGARLARWLFDQAAHSVPVRVRYPDGRLVGGAAEQYGAPEFVVVRPAAFFSRLARDTKIGFGEAYMAGDWRAGDGCDLADLLTPFAARLGSLVPRPVQRLRALVDRPLPTEHENTVGGARSNIAAHYDLSNELFAAFLDPTMTYSSAWFPEGNPRASLADLEVGQLHKIDAMLDLAQVRAGSTVLEIGSGWGALAIRAAQRGARVLTVTLSEEQLAEARRRIDAQGLADRVEVRLQDYREVSGRFDAIVSVEMLEAVGEAYWPTYFAGLDRLLAPGGTAAIQTITMPHERVLATRHTFGWVQKYIFPGGLIPSLRLVEQTLAQHTGLQIAARRDLGGHYADTLRLWRNQFMENWAEIQGQGFDHTFRRMWELYLAYSEAGFRSGYLDVSQLQLRRTA